MLTGESHSKEKRSVQLVSFANQWQSIDHRLTNTNQYRSGSRSGFGFIYLPATIYIKKEQEATSSLYSCAGAHGAQGASFL